MNSAGAWVVDEHGVALPSGEPSFEQRFRVRAPLAVVAAFHEGPGALSALQPPLSGTQFLRVDPLGEGSVTEFEMGYPPLSIRWRAVHRDVQRGRGFTDVQDAGPMAMWVHRHEYRPLSAEVTEVHDRIWFAHHQDQRAAITSVLFSTETLRLLFMYRALATARAVGAFGNVRGALAVLLGRR